MSVSSADDVSSIPWTENAEDSAAFLVKNPEENRQGRDRPDSSLDGSAVVPSFLHC